MKTKSTRVIHSFLWLSVIWSFCIGVMVYTGAHAGPSKKAQPKNLERGPASYVPPHPYQPGWKENSKSFQIPPHKEPSAGPLQLQMKVRRSNILLPGESPSSMPPSAQIIPLRSN